MGGKRGWRVGRACGEGEEREGKKAGGRRSMKSGVLEMGNGIRGECGIWVEERRRRGNGFATLLESRGSG